MYPPATMDFLSTCTTSDCVCKHFAATGICERYSMRRDVRLLYRALAEKEDDNDDALWLLLTSRHEYQKEVAALSNRVGRLEAELEDAKDRFERFKDPVEGDFTELAFPADIKRALSEMYSYLSMNYGLGAVQCTLRQLEEADVMDHFVVKILDEADKIAGRNARKVFELLEEMYRGGWYRFVKEHRDE
jgi:hypothetical protein